MRKTPTATDSAGRPWAGRSFAPTPPSTDDGSAPPALMLAIERFHSAVADETGVVEVLRQSRVFVPLVARLAETTVEHGLASDKRAELSIVTVAGPDGRNVLPVFSSVETLQRWNPKARPISQQMPLVALAAASDRTDLVVLDATSPSEYAVRRPALWAIAQSRPWSPSYLDPEVLAEFVASATQEPAVAAVRLAGGDPTARLAGPELIVILTIEDGLAPEALAGMTSRLQERWAASAVLAERVDSMGVRLVRRAE